MSYSLWSRGRLLGTSDLEFIRCIPLHRAGFLRPTAIGEQLLPDACGASPAFVAMSRRMQESPEDERSPIEAMRGTTEYADLAAAQDRCASLELELRRADGTLIPTEWIDVTDGEFLRELAREAEAEVAREPGSMADAYDVQLASELHPELEQELDFLHEPMELPSDGWDAAEDGMEDEVEDDTAPIEVPRYQLHVKLRDEADVP